MTIAPLCLLVDYNERCVCAGHIRSECNGCPGGFEYTASITLIPCYEGGPSGGNGDDDGNVSLDPILPIVNRDNCNDLKAKSNNQEFRDKMNELKADANGTTTGEQAFQTFSGTPKFSPKYSATASDPSNIIMPTQTRTDCTGFMHCHMNDPTLKNFAIFTPDDFIAQKYLIENSTAPVTSFTMYVTSEIQGISNIYAIKITDIAKFNVMAGLMEGNPLKYGNIWLTKIDYKNIPDIQVNNFLKVMQTNDFEGFELYKSDENLQNWEQLKLNNSGNTIKIKC